MSSWILFPESMKPPVESDAMTSGFPTLTFWLFKSLFYVKNLSK